MGDQITLASGSTNLFSGVQGQKAASVYSEVVHVPEYRKVVSSDVFVNARHQAIRSYIDNGSQRDTTKAYGLNSLITYAHHKLETRPTSDEAHGELIKDLSLLKVAVQKKNNQSFSVNVQYSAQKAITRAVWRNMPVRRTGLPGFFQTIRSAVNAKPQQNSFSAPVLRDVAILELNSLEKWVMRTGSEGEQEPWPTKARQQKIVKRTTELLPHLDAKRQAEVISAMVAASPAEPGALKAAEKWVRANLGNEQLNIVFTEVALLCKDEEMGDEATAFLERSKAVIPLLGEAGKTELRQILTDDVKPALEKKGWDKEGNTIRVQKIIDHIG